MKWLLPALARYPSRVLFKEFTGFSAAPLWISRTYHDFVQNLERSAAHWAQTLGEQSIQQKDVVGLWTTGVAYSDLVHIYGIARAGFVPEVLNAKMSIPVVRDLLAKTGGKALIYDPSFAKVVADAGRFEFPCLTIPDLHCLPIPSGLPDLPEVTPNDIALIFHTSGTTSGVPKPVPETHRWLKCQAQVQWPKIFQCYTAGQPLLVNNIGSFANVGSATTISYLSWSGHSLIQTSKPDFEVDEFLAMVNDEGLNAIILWFSKLLNTARTNPAVLSALKGMGQINYTGAALNPDDEAWATEQRIPVTALYATTESAGCLVSPLGEKGILPGMRVLEGINCKFIPTRGLDRTDLDGDAEQRSQGGQLFDLFLPAEADNCPHPSIRNRPDGHITGDLFEEVQPGLYCFRGRNDDWIRTGKDLCFCDTKSIEDNVLATCADLVQNCAVVGHYKPAVVLFVEPIRLSNVPEDDVMLREEILGRTRTFTDRLFEHEQINSLVQIVSVKSGSLPRTSEKGNIRRKAVEDDHAAELEEIYHQLKVW
ncbi:acetyl-CoA synthetase-like protein [Mycena maculata]|uniref:Acetyl-CoA synthetase-like protein n=1 Tax=Mycena maculata TaxID=230809 RepID=A0AAD7JG13_9AGAR|nr:acetyl-CoA synthetase-like protein [Mycena maculata]